MNHLRTVRSLARAWVLVLVPLTMAGCTAGVTHAPQPAPASAVPDTLIYCHDGTGHIPGATPWILGGKCCCTPTREMFEVHRAEKTVPADMTYEAYLKLYADRGIKIGPEHAGCNNRCADGPHAVFGGKCMAAPTPGTANYEQVTTGWRPTTH